MLKILSVRHSWLEPAGFEMHRSRGNQEYVLLHFHTPCHLCIDSEWRYTTPGTFVVIPPHVPQHMRCEEPLVHDWMHITGEIDLIMRKYGLEPGKIYHLPFTSCIGEYINQLEKSTYYNLPYSEEQVQVILNAIFIYVAQKLARQERSQSVSPESSELFKKLHNEMILYPARDWKAEDMARTAGVSVSRMYYIYKNLFGSTPQQDIIRYRIEIAKSILSTGASVAETAERCGYRNVSHFIRQFKQETGFTPKTYTY